ncbi:MAG: coproporphyrinogen dehydrogenase HemZ, partial [Lachnospiraceae bacterium]
MINFHLSRDDFEYDVRGLLMSFFPGEEFVKNQEEDAAPEEKAELTIEIPEGEGEDRIAQKNDMKRKLYHQLAAMTGKTLPWGALTGIRPTKIAMGFLEAGMSREEICREMESFYLVSPEKAALAADIAFREKEILKNIDYEQGYSLYIGIPFCPTTCLYCSFTSYPMSRWAPRMGEYLDALFREIDWAAEHFKGRKLN